MTWSTIDHADVNAIGIPDIETLYVFGGIDEFYDTNVTTRTTPWSPQELEDGSPAIEPMWRAYTRYDWIRDQHHAAGNTDYPDPGVDGDMSLICGSWSIDPATERTRLDGVPLGVFSYKATDTNPSGKADVLWGFDPSRMDHDSMIQAIHWVLDEHFGLELER